MAGLESELQMIGNVKLHYNFWNLDKKIFTLRVENENTHLRKTDSKMCHKTINEEKIVFLFIMNKLKIGPMNKNFKYSFTYSLCQYVLLVLFYEVLYDLPHSPGSSKHE